MAARRGLSRAQLAQVALRAIAAAERPQRPAPVPTLGRPRVVIDVDQAADRLPGTVAVVGGVPTLFVGGGRDWPARRGAVRPVAERFLDEPVVRISARSNAAAERARKRLRQVWRIRELLASGRLDDTGEARLLDLLNQM